MTHGYCQFSFMFNVCPWEINLFLCRGNIQNTKSIRLTLRLEEVRFHWIQQIFSTLANYQKKSSQEQYHVLSRSICYISRVVVDLSLHDLYFYLLYVSMAGDSICKIWKFFVQATYFMWFCSLNLNHLTAFSNLLIVLLTSKLLCLYSIDMRFAKQLEILHEKKVFIQFALH